MHAEPLTVDDFAPLIDGSVLDLMEPPTLNEWTAAIEQVRRDEQCAVYQGVVASQQSQFYGQSSYEQQIALNNAYLQRGIAWDGPSPEAVQRDWFASHAPVVDIVASTQDAVLLLHTHRTKHICDIPDSAYWILQRAEKRLDKELAAFLTGKPDVR